MRKLMRCENDFLAIGLLRSHMIRQHHAALARIFSLSWYLFTALSPVFAQLIRTHLCRGGGTTTLSLRISA
jgi:hypothetical protein